MATTVLTSHTDEALGSYSHAYASHATQNTGSLRCTHPGCSRLFNRRSKLEDHIRTHTGERPFKCSIPECGAAFRRADHLRRHEKSHENAEGASSVYESRPFVCQVVSEKGNCGRRFQLRHQLLRHVREVHEVMSSCDEKQEEVQSGSSNQRRRKRLARADSYQCEIGDCHATFHKRKLLRAHINIHHSDRGRSFEGLEKGEAERLARLPYPCTYDGCNKRFQTNSKRSAHVHQHHNNPTRYICTLEHPSDVAPDGFMSFVTWSDLQAHQREFHKPTCPYPLCGKTFTEKRNLRVHLERVHKEAVESLDHSEKNQYVDDQVFYASDMETNERPIAQAYVCEWQETPDSPHCGRTFTSKYNRDVHIRNIHLGLRAFSCTRSGCLRTFRSKRAALRHSAKCDSSVWESMDEEGSVATQDRSRSLTVDSETSDEFYRQEGGAVPERFSDRPCARKRKLDDGGLDTMKGFSIEKLSGLPYQEGDTLLSKKRLRRTRGRIIACPWPTLCHLRDGKESEEASASSWCPFRFSRLYDAQRHLQSQHGVQLSQAEIRLLLREEEQSMLGAARKGTKGATEDTGIV